MHLTVGKIIWAVSILLVFAIMYNSNWLIRIEGLFGDQIPIIQAYDPYDDEESIAESAVPEREAASGRDESSDTSTVDLGDALGDVGGLAISSAQPEEHIPEDHFEMLMEIEKLKWQVQNLEDRITKITVNDIANSNDNTLGDVMTILAALLPVVLPYLTRKYNNKEIFQKG